jgi:hypothetical protein
MESETIYTQISLDFLYTNKIETSMSRKFSSIDRDITLYT